MKIRKLLSPVKVIAAIGIAVVLVAGTAFTPEKPVVSAATVSELQAQAAALQAQIDANNARAAELALEADSLRKKIAEFDIQIQGVSTQIELTGVKIAELKERLDQAQKELDRQKELLKVSLRALYKKGGASSFELLIGSESFTDFINEQDYLERLKDGIQTSTEKVIKLKQQITEQKIEQEKLLKQQEEQKAQLDAARAERQSVLDYTQGQESAYREMADGLKQQQLAINRQIFAQSGAQIFPGDPGKGGYPSYLANAAHDSMVDPWGMLNRECVSYAAWKVHQGYVEGRNSRDMPSHWPSYWAMYGPGHGGNARDWIGDAAVDGIPYDRNPHAGDIGILVAGEYGHAVYVEEVMGGGQIYISQYNWDWNGNYSEAIINYTAANWYFIHFH